MPALLLLLLFLLVFGPALAVLSGGQFWTLLLIACTLAAVTAATGNSPRK